MCSTFLLLSSEPYHNIRAIMSNIEFLSTPPQPPSQQDIWSQWIGNSRHVNIVRQELTKMGLLSGPFIVSKLEAICELPTSFFIHIIVF